MRKNLAIDTDGYKQSHWKAIHEGLEHQYTYGESRIGSKYPNVCFLGLDIIIKENFLTVPTKGDLTEAREEVIDTFGYDIFNMEVWEKVRKLGYIPAEIKAVPEGSVIGINNVLFTTQSTEPWFAKTLNTLESLEMHVWYPTTISSRCRNIKRRLIPLVEKTGSIENLPYMVNDFGARGATCYEAGTIGGIGHLLHFEGSDNMPASRAIKDYYGYKGRAKSIWATEHSVALSYGEGKGEIEYILAQLDRCPENVPFANVIDTYDALGYLRNVISLPEVVEKIKTRTGRTVFRPDSSDPKVIVLQALDILASIFGFTINDKGYRVLNHNVGIIQGDGMNEETIIELYEIIIASGWSTDNLVTGSGGGLLQVDANRDTQRFAIKPSYGIINGKEVFFKKEPKTDMSKTSKSGQLKLHPLGNSGEYMTISSNDLGMDKFNFNSQVDVLRTVFKNGEYLGDNKFEDMIERAKILPKEL